MASPAPNPQVIRFGAFEVDLRTGELRKHGLRIKLQDQPFQILAMLLDYPGQLVTREQIKERLWPAETFVDFDHSVNTAIRRLRDALSDSADQPRYVETLPRRGYRFIAEVQPAEMAEPAKVIPISTPAAEAPTPASVVPAERTEPSPRPASPGAVGMFRRWRLVAVITAMAAIAAILAWRFWPQTPPGMIDSVAVLPFTADHDAELDYLSEGLAESVIDNLSELPQLKVMSRNSAFQYRQHQASTREIGRALGASALVLGSLRRNGDDLHITVELVDARSDRHLWGKEFDVKADQLAALQPGLAEDISHNLRWRLTTEAQSRIAQRQTQSGRAYLAYLRGRYTLNRRTNEGFKQALDYFQTAVDADPNYALAYSGMASAYGLLAFYGGMNSLEALRLSDAAAERAIQLDPLLADGYLSRGFARNTLHHDVAGAEREVRRAVELSPKSADTHHALALILSDAGKFEEALAESQLSEQLDPLWPGNRSTTGWIYYYAGRYDNALRLLNTFAASFSPAHWSRAMVYEEMKQYDRALHEFDTMQAISAVQTCQKAHVLAMAGRQAEARKLLAEVLARRKREYVSAYNIATIYAGLHEPGPMMEYLRLADQEYDAWLPRLRFDPRFNPYRSLPEFEDLQRKLTTPR